MAAPTPVARGTPGGRRIPEGFRILLTMNDTPTLSIYERDVKAMGVDGGELIDISTQHNVRWHTMYPRALVKSEPVTAACGFDPDVLPALRTAVNVNKQWTVRYPDNSTDAFYGALTKIEPTDMKEGEFPIYNLTIGVTNVDDSSSSTLTESGPVFTAASGT